MIFSFFLSLPAFFVSMLVGLLPVGGSLPVQFTSSVYTIWGDLNAFSFVIPVQTIVWCLGVAMIFHLAILVFRLVHWIITKIPFVG